MDVYTKTAIRNLLEVCRRNNVSSKEIKVDIKMVSVRFTLREDEKGEFNAYVTGEHEDVNRAIEVVSEIKNKFAYHNDKDKEVSLAPTSKEEQWAEVRFKVDADKIRNI